MMRSPGKAVSPPDVFWLKEWRVGQVQLCSFKEFISKELHIPHNYHYVKATVLPPSLPHSYHLLCVSCFPPSIPSCPFLTQCNLLSWSTISCWLKSFCFFIFQGEKIHSTVENPNTVRNIQGICGSNLDHQYEVEGFFSVKLNVYHVDRLIVELITVRTLYIKTFTIKSVDAMGNFLVKSFVVV